MIAICPTQQKLRSLSLGQLPEAQSDELLRHLENCENCQGEISQIDEVEDPLVGQLKLAGRDSNEFETETGCRIATTRALAALASVEPGATGGRLPNVPKSIGEYEIVKPLGQGGMGHVYLGEHTKLNRPVAIKFIVDHRLWDTTMHERFESEMRLIGGLKHPNIVVAHDAREVDGLAVLVTEYIDGMTVSEILKRSGMLCVSDACKIVSEVCRALDYIDSKGLVHRDIKPSNIMIDIDGNVKLLDLGLARLQSRDEEEGEFTATGQAMGTADYVAPEQVNDVRNVDIRADVYGLGCTFYKLLSGRAPFGPNHASAFAKMNAHISEVPASLSSLTECNEIPAELVRLVDRMLEKAPELRPQSPEEVQTCVDQYAGPSDLAALVSKSKLLPVQTPVAGVADPKQPKTESSSIRKFPWKIVIAGALAAFLFGLWLGITITIKKPDGTSATVEIPDGSTAIVDADGNIEIRLSGSDKTIKLPGANVTLPPRNFANSDSPSRNNRKTEIKPAKRGASTMPENRILRTETGFEARYLLTPDSPLYNKVEPGDLIDVYYVFLMGIKGGPSTVETRRLIASKTPVIRDEDSNAILFKISNAEANQLEAFKGFTQRLAVGHLMRTKFAAEFHNPENQLVEDNLRLNGVWRVVLTRVLGKVVDLGEQTFLFHRNRLIQLSGDQANSQLDFELKRKSGRRVIQIGGQDRTYRFLDNGRLELNGPSKEPAELGGLGMRLPVLGQVIRLEKVGKPETAQEKTAYEIIALSDQAKSEFECYLVEEYDEKDLSNLKRGRGDRLVQVPQSGKWLRSIGKPVITSKDVLSANATTSGAEGRFGLSIELTMEGGQKMRQVTRMNLNKPMMVLVDGKFIAAPVIQATINRSLALSGNFTRKEATRIANSIEPEIRFPEGLAVSNQTGRVKSLENLRQIMIALHNYENANKRLPTYAQSDKGKHAYSWRVAILPYLFQYELYEQYNFDERWDSEANSKVLNQMPDVFRHPSFAKDSTTTNYVGIVGNDAAFGVEKERRFADFTDGLTNTVFLIESKADIPWTKPEDFRLDTLNKSSSELYETLMKFVYLDEGGLGVGFGDAHSAFLDPAALTPGLTADANPADLPMPTTLNFLFQINDGVVIDRDQLPVPAFPEKQNGK